MTPPYCAPVLWSAIAATSLALFAAGWCGAIGYYGYAALLGLVGVAGIICYGFITMFILD